MSDDRRAADVIRLQKALADRGVASRRRAEELIVKGRVRVDGEAVMTLGTKVSPDAHIDVDGVPTREAVKRYVLLNKPKGVVSTANDERGRKTVVELIGARERLYPVGRLDTDSEGALLLTNDGDWAERVLHPRFGHEREYDVSVSGDLAPETITQLRNGIRLEEGLAVAARIDVRSRSRGASRLRMVLHTGWRRQVRRMLSVVGLRTVRLVRVRVGHLQLGNLRAGEWRELTPKEIADFAKPTETARKPGRRAAARLAATPKIAPRAQPSTNSAPIVSTTGAVPKPSQRAAPRRLGATGSPGAARRAQGPLPLPSAPRPLRPLPRTRTTSFAGPPRSASPARGPKAAPRGRVRSPGRPSMSSSPSRSTPTAPARGPALGGRPIAPLRPGRPQTQNRAPTRRLPSLTRPAIRRPPPRGAPAGPRRPPARGPQRFGRRPPPKYGASRGPVRAKTGPR